MKIKSEPLKGLIILELDKFHDERGYFFESFSKKAYQRIRITEEFVQDNLSRSKKNVLRGLHFQPLKPQSQLVTVIRGTIFDVCVDMRKDSPSFGHWHSVELDEESSNQIYMAPGFAHGFYVLSDYADVHYKVSEVYDPKNEGGIVWNDISLNINWPSKTPIISEKDKENISFEEYIKSSA